MPPLIDCVAHFFFLLQMLDAVAKVRAPATTMTPAGGRTSSIGEVDPELSCRTRADLMNGPCACSFGDEWRFLRPWTCMAILGVGWGAAIRTGTLGDCL